MANGDELKKEAQSDVLPQKEKIENTASREADVEISKGQVGTNSEEMIQKNEVATGLPETGYRGILDLASAKAIEELNTKIQSIRNDVNNKLNDEQRNIDRKIEKIEDKLNRLDDKQINIIETIAIFVALFTFVSIDFQVFRTYQHPQAIAGLTLILLGSLLTFITILDFVLNFRLPITKIRKIAGQISPIIEMQKTFVGYQEEIEFSWIDPKTWGLALKVKFLPLLTIWILFIMIGVLLFVCSPKTTAESIDSSNCKIENQGSTIQIKGNAIELPNANE